MARTREFSEEATLAQITDVFVANGFNGTSIQMLIDATGLGKQSLYNAFGDKRALYTQAVDCAGTRFLEVAQAMDAAPSGRGALDVFFKSLAQQCGSKVAADRACIVSLGLLEAVEDTDLQANLKAKWRGTHGLLTAAIKRGQADGSIANAAVATELSDYLMALISGARVNVQAGVGAERIRRTIAQGLKILDVP